MTRRLPSPILALLAIIFGLSVTPAAAAAKTPKKSAKATASSKKTTRRDVKTTARADRGRAKSSRNSKREVARGKTSRRDARASRTADNRRGRASKNNSKNSRREVARVLSQKQLKKLSPRERRAYLSKQARARHEAAERARRAAIARALYLARIRAQDQAFRDEAQANIRRDETTGEDLEVRRVAMEALGSHAGSVVVMDPKTGRVYTVVNQDWALRKGFKPCSTVKLVTGLAGLSDKVIDPVQTINISTGSLSIDLTDSLAYSNNYYFQRVGGQVGFDRMMFYARKLGLGQPTGINHPGESAGRLPLIKDGFAVSRMSSHGDDIEVTPIQLANMAAAIANGGNLLVPHLPRTPEETLKFKAEQRAKLDIPEDHLRRVIPGMVGAVNYGSGHTAYDPTQTIAGKTGTCISQDQYRTWLGLFTSFAPVHDPKLAVAVVTRGSGQRGKIAAGIAGRIYKGLSHRFGVRGTSPALLANETLVPRPKIDPSKAAVLNEEEAEAEAEAEAEMNAQAEESFAVEGTEEAGKNVAPAANGPQTGVRSTSKIYEKPIAPTTTATPRRLPIAVPSITEKSAPPPAQSEGRPRRVNPEERQ